MLSPAHSWLLIVGLTSLLLVIYVLVERVGDSLYEENDDDSDDDFVFDHADADIGI